MKRTKGELLGNTENVKNSKFVANNTLRIEYNDGTVAIRLHNTDVVTIVKDGYILNSGGWRTQTTKDRINSFCSPARISQVNNIWYLRDGNQFYDGCKIDLQGKLISRPKNIDLAKVDKLKKQISNYCKLITEDNLPYPDNGDCWFCSMHTEDGTTWGDKTDSEHLLNHLTEKYLHGSILVNAMREYGFEDRQIGVHYHLKITDTFRRAVRRYLQKRLLPDIQTR